MGDKAAILQDYYTQVWERGQIDRIPDFFSTQGQISGLVPDQAMSPADMADLIDVWHTRVSHVSSRIVHALEEGDWLSALVELRGVETDTGRPLSIRGQVMVRFDDRMRIAEGYFSFDFLSLFEEFGQLPRNAFALLITGAVFR